MRRNDLTHGSRAWFQSMVPEQGSRAGPSTWLVLAKRTSTAQTPGRETYMVS